VFLFAFLGGFLLAGFVPPPHASWDAGQTAQFYIEHRSRIQAGGLIMLIFGVASVPWICVVTLQIRRLEGQLGIITLSQFVTGILIPIAMTWPVIVLLATVFRDPAHRDIQVTQALSDVWWMMFVGQTNGVILQCCLIAFAILCDRRERPLFPRWVAYVNILFAFCSIPESACLLFNSGPVSWYGAWAFWLALFSTAGWMVTMTTTLPRAIMAPDEAPPDGLGSPGSEPSAPQLDTAVLR